MTVGQPPVAPSEGGGEPHSLAGMLFGVNLRQLATFFRQLATMVGGGLTSGRAIATLAPHSEGHFGAALRAIGGGLDAGQPLHVCLGRYPEYFSELVVCLVQAGETGGQLDARLNEIADLLEQSYTLRQRVMSQCVYPVVILHAAIFIPPLFRLFTGGPGAYVAAVVPPLVILYGLFFSVLLGRRFVGMVPGLRTGASAFMLGLPLLGRVVRDGALLRALRALGDLLEAGVSTGRALQIASRASGQAALGARLARAEALLDEGRTLSGALAGTGAIPPTVMQMIAVGEETGTMGTSLRKAADLLQIDFDTSLQRVSAVVPPLLLLVVAGLVALQIYSFFRGYLTTLNSLFP